MQKIIPHLWFNKEAEEATKFYTSVFNGKVIGKTHYPEAGQDIHGQKAGSVMTVEFEIDNFLFLALNAGPLFTFTPAISFMVNCSSKEEVDALWNKLSEGGTALMPIATYPFSERYGWIQDKYGLSWQLIYTPDTTQRSIVPSLLFVGDVAGKAEEAMNFYTSIFPKSEVGTIARYGADQEYDKEGTVMYGEFFLVGQKFIAMDSAHPGHHFSFSEAISLMVTCKDQEEIDTYWNALSAVPEAEQCGWLKDKYGMSWQIIPADMDNMLNNPDKEKAKKAMEAMLAMKKIDIAKLQSI